jgi:predicted regulator of Ras-like GTPase activity (Roadblock/LC7/MglB family)
MAQVTQLDDRIAKCNKILNENPNSQIFAALAEAYRKKGELDKAFRICQTGLKIHPNYGSAHMVMAKVNLDKGLYDWSEMETRKAIELDGNSHATDLLLAEIHIRRGEFAKATKILDRLQSADPNNQHVMKLLELAKKIPLEAPQMSTSVSRPKPKVKEAEEPHEADRPQEKAPRIPERLTIKDLIELVSEVTGVEGVILINSEGLVAESKWPGSDSPDAYAAIAKDIESTAQSQIDISGFGKCQNIFCEAGDLVLNLLPLKENLLLIKANNRVNLGRLRLKLAGLLGKLDYDFS